METEERLCRPIMNAMIAGNIKKNAKIIAGCVATRSTTVMPEIPKGSATMKNTAVMPVP